MGGPKALGPSLAQRLLGRPRKPAGWASVSPCPSLPPTPQGHSEMSFLQLSGAEVTPAQQITLKVEQCPPARQGQGSSLVRTSKIPCAATSTWRSQISK